jgi:hypothetical protein
MWKITWRRFLRAIYALVGIHFVAAMGYAILMAGFSAFAPSSEWQPGYRSYEILHLCVLVFSIPVMLWVLFAEQSGESDGILREGVCIHKVTWSRLRRAVYYIAIMQAAAILVCIGILKLLSYSDVFGYAIFSMRFHVCVLIISVPISLWIIFIEPEQT